MANRFTCSVTALLCLCVSIFAAPPLIHPPSSTLRPALWTLPLNISTLHLATLPPYPPPDPFIYQVSHSKVTLVFSKYGTQKRDESFVALALRFATMAVFEHDSQAPLSSKKHVWRAGKVALVVEPMREGPDQVSVLTWKLWLDAITGLRVFTGAYPGVKFSFGMYVPEVVKGEQEPVLVGRGTLGAN